MLVTVKFSSRVSFELVCHITGFGVDEDAEKMAQKHALETALASAVKNRQFLQAGEFQAALDKIMQAVVNCRAASVMSVEFLYGAWLSCCRSIAQLGCRCLISVFGMCS